MNWILPVNWNSYGNMKIKVISIAVGVLEKGTKGPDKILVVVDIRETIKTF